MPVTVPITVPSCRALPVDILPNQGDGFAGHVTPQTAWSHVQANPLALLVDVRTQAEWAFVGLPDVSAAQGRLICAEWQSYPDFQINPDFVAQVTSAIEQAPSDIKEQQESPIFMLCRSGARSQSAAVALTASGYGRCYNVAGGFEGDADMDGHRGFINGWKFDGCPWRQS